ncbi:2-dehydro-3-deoxygalactonokinase [Rhodobacteraceae bacterium B1Z28]|uniref:2-dehydro-3-deoxygalactonokinase n=1 Tax=Ruegeria haliotis TaxID=2747601 RepID=A0ABX2PQC7_9RHOB|nr:2-dehydro-3-deoxygalactonokinase [Ruegeria haliotis]NVO56355.1 2-dehydro-3-deoxygalactonokinase [Ruegeria haliotis]
MNIEWIAVDWGTSHLRAWAMQGETVLDQAQSDNGMARLAKSGFQTALLDVIEGWLGSAPLDVVACGMVGARQGWVEAPYSTVPSAPVPVVPVYVPNTDPRIRVFVVPGLKQDNPPDVMRGEETQIAGFLASRQNWDGVLCLPGTHTKWVQVSAGEVVSFRTFMTGELFDLLRCHSVLRHSISDGWDETAFLDAVSDTLSKPEQLAARLFGLRAMDLLQGQASGIARARLSGSLIGVELAATRAYWLGQQLAIIGADNVSQIYAKALQQQGAFVEVANATRSTLAGLAQARNLTRQTA